MLPPWYSGSPFVEGGEGLYHTEHRLVSGGRGPSWSVRVTLITPRLLGRYQGPLMYEVFMGIERVHPALGDGTSLTVTYRGQMPDGSVEDPDGR